MRGFPNPSSVADDATEDAEEDDDEEEEEEEEEEDDEAEDEDEDAEEVDESPPLTFGKPKVAVLVPPNDSIATRASMAAPAAAATAASDGFAFTPTVPEEGLGAT